MTKSNGDRTIAGIDPDAYTMGLLLSVDKSRCCQTPLCVYGSESGLNCILIRFTSLRSIGEWVAYCNISVES